MNVSLRLLGSAVVGLALAGGCDMMNNDKAGDHAGHADHQTQTKSMAQTGTKVAEAQVKPSKAATTQPTMNNVNGTVTFTDLGDGKVKVVAHITGLTPNSAHGFHVHESENMSSADLMSTGGHYNPDKHAHGGPTTSPVHAGDLGNITSDAQGNAHYEITVEGISIGGKNDIIGKPVIIHAKADDFKSQPAGNAGARIAGGIIEIKK